MEKITKKLKGEWSFILNKKIKYYTKETLKYFNIILASLGIIIAIILIKYKPSYKISIFGEELGYVNSKEALEENIKNEILEENENKNIDSIDIKLEPNYELKLVDRSVDTNKIKITQNLENKIVVTYKYYDIAVNDSVINSVNTLEEAEQLVDLAKIKNNDTSELSIVEKYTQNIEDVSITTAEIAKNDISEKISEQVTKQEQEKQRDEEENNLIATISGVKIATKPVNGTITSRYGVSSRIRSSNHTGLDIATATGTPINVVADGTVTNASYQGAYGNLVKINHGNGVETWYAHTSKMYVTEGQKVSAGEVIAAVGSTGNSTGAHLHFEIRINGQHVNPQNYLYK